MLVRCVYIVVSVVAVLFVCYTAIMNSLQNMYAKVKYIPGIACFVGGLGFFTHMLMLLSARGSSAESNTDAAFGIVLILSAFACFQKAGVNINIDV